MSDEWVKVMNYSLIAGNPAYGRITRPRVKEGASPLKSITEGSVIVDE